VIGVVDFRPGLVKFEHPFTAYLVSFSEVVLALVVPRFVAKLRMCFGFVIGLMGVDFELMFVP